MKFLTMIDQSPSGSNSRVSWQYGVAAPYCFEPFRLVTFWHPILSDSSKGAET